MHAGIGVRKDVMDESPSLSDILLRHDGLMTPVLKRHFGAIFVRQNAAVETPSIYCRYSTVKQRGSASILLDAVLTINTAVLPKPLMNLLRSTSKPFGELLTDYGFDIQITERVLIIPDDPSGVGARKGRRHKMVFADSGVKVCEVRELLAPEPDLLNARDFHSKRGQPG